MPMDYKKALAAQALEKRRESEAVTVTEEVQR